MYLKVYSKTKIKDKFVKIIFISLMTISYIYKYIYRKIKLIKAYKDILIKHKC